MLELRMHRLRSIHGDVVHLEEHMAAWEVVVGALATFGREHWTLVLWSIHLGTLARWLDMCHLKVGALHMWIWLVIS